MKSKISIKALTALLTALVPILLAAVNQVSYIAHYNGQMTIGTDTLGGVTYATIHYDGLNNGFAPGLPSLPIDYLYFSVPYNATHFTVTATPTFWSNRNLDYVIYPCQAPRMISDTTPVVITLPDTAAYYSGNFYPNGHAWIVSEGYLAGENHIVTVAVMPFSYSHTSNSDIVKKARYVTVRLNYEISDSLELYPIMRNDSALRREGFELTKSIVVNPGSVMSFSPPSSFNIDTTGLVINPTIPGNGLNNGILGGDWPIINPPSFDSTYVNPNPGMINEASYPYLIVTTQDYYHSLRRLAAFKRQKGYNVKVVTMDQVMCDSIASAGDRVRKHDGSYQITDTSSVGVLRQFLKNYYAKYGTRFVLFVGDGVPYKCRNMRIDTTVYSVPSDLYYGELNADWSTDKIGFLPELYVGRIIAKDAKQIDNYTDKLMRYEMNPGNGDYSYLKRAFYSQGYDLINSNEVNTVRYQMNKIFSVSKVLSESRDINDRSKIPSGEMIIDTINANNYGFVSFHNHGAPSGLVTYGIRNRCCVDYLRFLWAIDSIHVFQDQPSRANDDPSTKNGLNNLTNKLYPSIGYSTACNLMPFGTLPGYASIPMNFGESFTTGKDYGGPAFMGNTCTGFTPSTSYHEAAFGMMIRNGYYKIGVANALAKPCIYMPGDTIKHDYTSVCQNLLGDPEFEIWTDEPSEYSNISITRTENSIEITGIDAEATTVAFCGSNGNIGKTEITALSVTLNDISPNSSIMLYSHNYIPYIAPLILQNYNIDHSQYVIASDVIAGMSIDSSRYYGTVIVRNGACYEIEAKGTVRLEDGFKVEKGATFVVSPSCF